MSPRRADQLEMERLIRGVEAAPGAPYGLTRWSGLCSLGGHSWVSPVGLRHIELVYGEPPDGPYLRVGTRWKLLGHPDVELRWVKAELARRLWRDGVGPPPGGLSPEEAARWAARRYQEFEHRPIPEWSPVRLAIGDTMRDGQMLVDGDDRVAVADLPDAVVTVRTHGLPVGLVALTHVDDLTPYIEGTTELRNRSSLR